MGLNFAQILLYIILILRLISKYRAGLADEYSFVEKIDLKWINTLLVLISLHWLFVVTRGSMGLFNVGSHDLLRVIDLFSVTIFLVFQLRLFTA